MPVGDRPDPELGIFTTMLVRDGLAENVGAHLARLERSARELYGRELPGDLEARIAATAAADPVQRLRVLVGESGASVNLEATPLDRVPDRERALLAPVHLAGGLGSHKWRDRRLLDRVEDELGALPLIVDGGGEVLEAATANVLIVEGATVVTPPLDGRLLPGTVRERVLGAARDAGLQVSEEPISLDRLAAADELLLSSAIKGLRPAGLAGSPAPRFEVGARLFAAVRGPTMAAAG